MVKNTEEVKKKISDLSKKSKEEMTKKCIEVMGFNTSDVINLTKEEFIDHKLPILLISILTIMQKSIMSVRATLEEENE